MAMKELFQGDTIQKYRLYGICPYVNLGRPLGLVENPQLLSIIWIRSMLVPKLPA